MDDLGFSSGLQEIFGKNIEDIVRGMNIMTLERMQIIATRNTQHYMYTAFFIAMEEDEEEVPNPTTGQSSGFFKYCEVM